MRREAPPAGCERLTPVIPLLGFSQLRETALLSSRAFYFCWWPTTHHHGSPLTTGDIQTYVSSHCSWLLLLLIEIPANLLLPPSPTQPAQPPTTFYCHFWSRTENHRRWQTLINFSLSSCLCDSGLECCSNPAGGRIYHNRYWQHSRVYYIQPGHFRLYLQFLPPFCSRGQIFSPVLVLGNNSVRWLF